MGELCLPTMGGRPPGGKPMECDDFPDSPAQPGTYLPSLLDWMHDVHTRRVLQSREG